MRPAQECQKLVTRAKQYPFGYPADSYVFVEGDVWKLCEFGKTSNIESALVELSGSVQTLSDALTRRGIDPDILRLPRKAILASGSNASPIRLREKFPANSDQTLIPVVKYQVPDLVSVFSAKFASYGSITATLQHAPNIGSEIFVTYLTQTQLARMHKTEAIGDEYNFVQIRDTPIYRNGERCAIGPVYAYLSRKGILSIGKRQFTLTETKGPSKSFSMKSQEQVLHMAWELLESKDSLDTFICQNITDEGIRRYRNSLLQEYSTPFRNANTEIMNGPVELLF